MATGNRPISARHDATSNGIGAAERYGIREPSGAPFECVLDGESCDVAVCNTSAQRIMGT